MCATCLRPSLPRFGTKSKELDPYPIGTLDGCGGSLRSGLLDNNDNKHESAVFLLLLLAIPFKNRLDWIGRTNVYPPVMKRYVLERCVVFVGVVVVKIREAP